MAVLKSTDAETKAPATTDPETAKVDPAPAAKGKQEPDLGKPPAEIKPPTETKAPATTGVTATVYLVAEGKLVTTLRGPMGAFQEVYARDFVHGQADLDELVALGSLSPKS